MKYVSLIPTLKTKSLFSLYYFSYRFHYVAYVVRLSAFQLHKSVMLTVPELSDNSRSNVGLFF